MKLLLTILLASIGGAEPYAWISLFLVPITGIVSWFVSRKVRNNSTLQQLQSTIDMLVQKNGELYAQLVAVRNENAELKQGQDKLSAQLTAVQQENADLKRQIEALHRPAHTKTSTK